MLTTLPTGGSVSFGNGALFDASAFEFHRNAASKSYHAVCDELMEIAVDAIRQDAHMIARRFCADSNRPPSHARTA